jgi:spermidine/putrescine transport system permease protein
VAALSSFVVLMIGVIFAVLMFLTRRFADLSMSFRSLQS